MKRKIRKFYQAVIAELTEHENTFFVYFGLRLLVLGILILQIFHQNYENAFLCILTLILMITPSVIQATLKVEFPSPLEIIVLILIFSAEILGEIRSFYMRVLYWDTVLHTLNGFLCAAIGFSLVDIMNRQGKMKFDLSPLSMAITAFSFSMTIGVLWEFFEFGMDFLWNLDMQKDTVIHSIHSTLLNTGGQNQSIHITNIQEVVIDRRLLGYWFADTMSDLIVNFIGAIIFSTMGYFYAKHRNSKSLAKGFVPEPWSKEKHSDIEG